MTELAIDTSTETAGIALSNQGKMIAELNWHTGQSHTTELTANLTFIFKQAMIDLKDISCVIVAKGPGNFNGLRVGMSFAKGFALSLHIPIVGISTLEVEAFPYASTVLPICPIQNAGRGEIAAALFQTKRGKWHRLIEEHITTIERLIPEITGPTIVSWEMQQACIRQRDEYQVHKSRKMESSA